jgi:pilus assembly protein CpaF
MNRLLTLWSACPGDGSRTLARTLAQVWSGQEVSVLLIQHVSETELEANPMLPEFTPEEWVRQFRGLSPMLLRNYLIHTPAQPAQIKLARFPSLATWQEFLALVKNAFCWTLFTSSVDWSEESLATLDASDALLWAYRAQVESTQALQAHIGRMTGLKYSLAFSQKVLNRAHSGGSKALFELPEEIPPGVRYAEAVKTLAELLQSRDDLYLPKTARDTVSDPRDSVHLVQEIKAQIQPELLKVLEAKEKKSQAAANEESERALTQKTIEAALAQNSEFNTAREAREEIVAQVMNEVLGLGPLEPLLKDPDVSEVMVNGKDCVFVEKKGKLHPTPTRFASDTQLRTVIDRIVAPIGRRVDEAMPLCDARLADGSRVNIVLPPLALDGPTITIRKFMNKRLSFDDLISYGSMTREMADFLRVCVFLRKNIVVSGGTGSGKTTLLNALSGLIPEDERIVTIEDAAELKLQKPHVVRLESRPANAEGEGAIPIRRLVINALRMRPDRIVVGECRGGEALDMLQAMNTGHDGSLTTIHANSPRDGLGRLETLVLMAGLDLPVRVVREQIRSAVHIIIQQSRLGDGSRKVTSITEVTGMEGEILTTQELFHFRVAGIGDRGRIQGAFEATGIVATFSQEARRLAWT